MTRPTGPRRPKPDHTLATTEAVAAQTAQLGRIADALDRIAHAIDPTLVLPLPEETNQSPSALADPIKIGLRKQTGDQRPVIVLAKPTRWLR